MYPTARDLTLAGRGTKFEEKRGRFPTTPLETRPLTHRSSRICAATALALLFGTLLPGCLIGSSSKTDHSGRYLSESTMREVEPGASKDFVLSVCGEPTERIDGANGAELWKWEYEQTTDSSGSVLFLISSQKKTRAEGAVWVKFEGDAVVRVWRDSPGS